MVRSKQGVEANLAAVFRGIRCPLMAQRGHDHSVACGSSVSRFEGAFCDVDVTIYELKTRALQAYLGHKNIQQTVRYTELSPTRFKDFWRK